jgi:4'-phosphopantetheinyl transferase EntD
MQFKISKTFNQTEELQWEQLISHTLGQGVHAERKKGYIFAREALRLLFQQEGKVLTIADLREMNFHSVPSHLNYTFSLAHTKGAGAAVLANRSDYMAVGIDLEIMNREVKETIIQRVAHPMDVPLRNIETWCLKEAIFKCLMNSGRFDRPFDFSEIQIATGSWRHSPSALKGEWQLHFMNEMVVALALLPL